MADAMIEGLFFSFAAAVGVAVGMWLRRRVSPVKAFQEARAQQLRARAALAQLHDVATGVAAKVGQHNTRVREINEELTSLEDQGPETVVSTITKLVQANEEMQKQLDSAEKKLEEQARRLALSETQARTDPLTQLANRRVFDEEVERCQAAFQADGRPATVMILDIDYFKKFNDTYGHQMGDEVLRGVARVLMTNVQQAGVVARYGGEEFAVVFHGSPLEDCKQVAERTRRAIGAAAFSVGDADLHVTVSAGLAEFLPADDAESFVKRADRALYASKASGRNCSHWHDGRKTRLLRIEPESHQDSEPRERRRDPVTGLSRRSEFCDEVRRRTAERNRGGASFAVIFARIDDYDGIVDQFGGEGGELAIRAGAQFLKATTREMDHLARYDESTLAVLLPQATLSDVAAIAERLRKAVGRCRLPLADGQLQFTVSVGATMVLKDDSYEELLERAWTSVNAATDQGRDRCFLHNGRDCLPSESGPRPDGHHVSRTSGPGRTGAPGNVRERGRPQAPKTD